MKKIYLSLLLLMLGSPALMAQIYVTEAGAGLKNGTSWANAYDNTQLQQAINEAESATTKQVWVAKGIYKPTERLSEEIYAARTDDGTIAPTAANDSDKSFILKTGVAIYGGFAGTEATIAERTSITTLNETILSGDLNNSNTANTDDAYHVVAARDDADGSVLDGFTIQHGYGNDGNYAQITGDRIRRSIGAAIAVFTAKTVTFNNLVVKNNQTTNAGGAVFIVTKHQDAKFYFTNVRFEDNSATGIGGVIYSQLDVGASQLNITDCVFLNNSAGGGTGAGALYFAGASSNPILNISNSRFENNTVSNAGATTTYAGALRIGTGVANISNTVFKGNKAGSDKEGKGGAIYSTSGAIVNANGCTFENNAATADGGHWNVFSGVTTITNSTFTDGEAATGGAFYLSTAGTLNIASSTFNGNTSSANGGAIYQIGATSILDVKSSTFDNNSATTSGGAVYCYTGNTTIANSMFKANNANSGGALYNLASTIDIQKTRFYTNIANASGGALYLYSGATTPSATLISNSIFYDNYSKTATTGGAGGGAIFQTRQSTGTTSTVNVVNSVFYANKSVNENPAYSFGGYVDVKTNLYNNIFYGNMGNYNEATQTGSATLDIRRSATTTTAIQVYKNNLFQADITNINNRTVADAYLLNTTTPEPLFASTNPADPNFLYPTSNSFAKDKGDNGLYTTVVEDTSTSKDILGNPRLVNGGTDNVDLGAIEWSTVLPVKIVSFAANLANNRTQLKWNVGTEDNVNRYEIERSQNGTDFTKVAEVQANGSSSYTTTDANPQVGVNYYRLITVDNDGTYSIYIAIQSVKINTLNTEAVKIHPNPVKDGKVNISLIGYPTGTYNYKLVSTAGLVAQQGQLHYDGAFGTINLPSSLASGVYAIQLSLGDRIVQTKLIKQ